MTLIKDFQYQSVTCKGEEMSESFIIITLWHFPLPLTLICGNILEYIITKDANQHGTHIANALGQLYVLQIGFTCTRRAAATQTQHAASGQSRNIANIFASTVDHTAGYLIWEQSRGLKFINLSRLASPPALLTLVRFLLQLGERCGNGSATDYSTLGNSSCCHRCAGTLWIYLIGIFTQ